ncbi:4Fe-4S binding protein [Dinoroseobacter sp. S375]|uniref:4Fe-4S binding protein n=1 Tax=Dinoroseobacter sp. S375 TaxID=3415136 RepID=UPI003C7E887E
MPKTLLLCDCLGTQTVDADALSEATGMACSKVHTGLCMHQTEALATAIATGETAVACAQETQLFEELAEDLGVEAPLTFDLRDRAGWSEQGAEAGPKMAALVADALIEAPATPAVDISSAGQCLILGRPEVALAAAEQLAEHLSVTVLLETAEDLPLHRGFDVVVGKLRSATGSLGQFAITLDALQQVQPGGRGAFALTPPQDGARTECDLVLDLRGGASLFPAPEKRDGYLRADPGAPNLVAGAVLAASHMVGTYEKPLHVGLSQPLCAHSRAGQEACRNCLDICPTGAISPDGDHVTIDPMICAGCGACAALCPSGAITAQDPPVPYLMRRVGAMVQAYTKAGGTAPRLLVHDAGHGAEMIALSARFGRGLPADVIPMSLEKVSGFGHAEALGALASGFAAVDVLIAPTTEREALDREVALANALSDTSRMGLIDVADPDALSDHLYGADVAPNAVQPVLPMGDRRQITRLAAKALHGSESDAVLSLPENAPYGAVLVDTNSCTLCLSCVSLCPSGALTDNPDMPQLKFQEDACLQCGLCADICPEKAIALEPQFNLGDSALSEVVKHEEEPAACIECGALFGVKSTIEKIVEKLEGKHHMFANSDAAKMIRMCDDCRVNAQFHSQNNPFAGNERPKPRTTADYYSDRKDH